MRWILAAPIAALAAACTGDVPAHTSYDVDVAPILQANCLRCHGANNASTDGSNCLRIDLWNGLPDATNACGPMIKGIRDDDDTIVSRVLAGTMPADGPALTARQRQILQNWATDGYPRHAVNHPPTITFTTPPAGDTTVDQSYDVTYDVSDPDGDPVTWSLTYAPAGGTDTFATGLTDGQGTLTIDTSHLASGTYTLTANLDDGSNATDGSSMVSIDAPGTLTVPAGRNAAPTVAISAPNSGNSYYQTDSVDITWTGNDDGAQLTCDVTATSGGTPVTIAPGVTETPGTPVTQTWDLASVPPGTYTITVTVNDDGTPSLSAMATTSITVTGPPAQVKFGTQVLPILTNNCAKTACHGNVQTQKGLNLTSSQAYANLVGVASQECPSNVRVKAGDPANSYVIWKLRGDMTQGCWSGSQMPKGSPLTSAQIQTISDWIANGAPNN